MIDLAIEALKKGQLVAFPTETVYGLGADARNAEALHRLYTVKGRPLNHPVIVHLADISQLALWAEDISPMAICLAKTFWPGPLTLIFKKQPHVLPEITGGQDTIGIRIPNHPVALSLLSEYKGGIAAPSANRFGRISPTSWLHVRQEFSEQEVPIVLEGGGCEVGIESTIVDVSQLPSLETGTGSSEYWHPSTLVLRPGMITAQEIATVLDPYFPNRSSGKKNAPEFKKNLSTIQVSGNLPSHYAPFAPLKIISGDQWLSTLETMLSSQKRIGVLAQSPPPESSIVTAALDCLYWITQEGDHAAYAQFLYCNLRQLDAWKPDCILVQALPETPEWLGIQDRLKRASHHSSFKNMNYL